MRHSTHILTSLFFITSVYVIIPPIELLTPFVYAMILAPIGALVPDLDHPHSYISRGNWEFISLAVRKTTTHRGWTHSLMGATLFTFIIGIIFVIFGSSFFYIVPFMIGYLSHLLSDSLNPTGVNWFYPKIKKKYKIKSRSYTISTGSRREEIFHNILLIAMVAIFAYDVIYNSGSLIN